MEKIKVLIFADLNVFENAAYYYEKAKEARKKIERLEEEIKRTEEEIANFRKKEKKLKRKKEWYEKFHYSFTSGGALILAGRDAHQNDILVKRYMEEQDLFFHADVVGAAAVILKGGVLSSEEDQKEAAQIAACFSSAWKAGYSAVDVYAVRKSQLSKYESGAFVGKGAFVIKGERKWFRGMELKLIVCAENGRAMIFSALTKRRPSRFFYIVPSLKGKEKGALAKSLAKHFDVEPEEFLSVLPNGRSITIAP